MEKKKAMVDILATIFFFQLKLVISLQIKTLHFFFARHYV